MTRTSDPTEMTAFCAREWPRLVGSISLLVGSAGDAEEIAQEVLVRVCQHWSRVRRMEAPGAWAHRVAINLTWSHLRRVTAARRAMARAHPTDRVDDPDVATTVAVRAARSTRCARPGCARCTRRSPMSESHEALHAMLADAAATPSGPVDMTRVVARAKSRRRWRVVTSAVAACTVVAVLAASVTATIQRTRRHVVTIEPTTHSTASTTPPAAGFSASPPAPVDGHAPEPATFASVREPTSGPNHTAIVSAKSGRVLKVLPALGASFVSPDGRTLYIPTFSQCTTRWTAYDVASGHTTPVFRDLPIAGGIAVSPDGRKVAYVTRVGTPRTPHPPHVPNCRPDYQLVVRDTQTGVTRRWTGGPDFPPARLQWNSTSSKVAFDLGDENHRPFSSTHVLDINAPTSTLNAVPRLAPTRPSCELDTSVFVPGTNHLLVGQKCPDDMRLVEYDVATRRPVRSTLIDGTPRPDYPLGLQGLAIDPSGRHVIYTWLNAVVVLRDDGPHAIAANIGLVGWRTT